MKILKLITFTAITIWMISCSSSSYKEDRPKTPEELRAELKRQELKNPVEYLEDKNVTLQPQKKKIRNGGLFRDAEYADDGAIIGGDFINKATIAKFKDIVVKISYYSQTKTLIDEKSYVFYEYYEPNTTKHFSIKVDALPKAYASFSFQVTGAKPADQ